MNLRIACSLFVLACAACSSSSASPATATPTTPVPTTQANGTIGTWQSLTALPTPRANHCAVAANGFLVVIGGNYLPAGASAFQSIADVHVAKINPADGTLGAWQVAGQTPSPVNSCTAASDGNDVVLVDGIYDDDSFGGKIRRATLSSDGVLGAWNELGALPTNVRVLYSSATITGGLLRAAYAQLDDSGAGGIALLESNVTGTAATEWQNAQWLSGFRGHPQYAFATLASGGLVTYALGGYASSDDTNAVLATSEATLIDATGAPTGSFGITPLPNPTAFGQAVAVDDFVFMVGGKNGVLSGSGVPDTYSSAIGADGSLGAWTAGPPLPEGRTSLALTLAGDFVYATGGGFDAGGLATVFAARVRYTN